MNIQTAQPRGRTNNLFYFFIGAIVGLLFGAVCCLPLAFAACVAASKIEQALHIPIDPETMLKLILECSIGYGVWFLLFILGLWGLRGVSFWYGFAATFPIPTILVIAYVASIPPTVHWI